MAGIPSGATAWGGRWTYGKAAKAPAPTTAPKPAQLGATAISQLGNAYAAKNPGWTPPAGSVPAGVQMSPGSAGVQTAPVPPFMTGPDIINFGDAYKSHEDQIAQADKDLGDIKASAQTALYNIGRNYLQGTDNTQNDAAARGIFQSSIKDGALADLAATKATMSSDVNTRVNNAQLFHDSALGRINDWWNNFQEGMNSVKVSNAAEAGATSPPNSKEPTSTNFAPIVGSSPNPWVNAWLQKNPGKTWPAS